MLEIQIPYAIAKAKKKRKKAEKTIAAINLKTAIATSSRKKNRISNRQGQN